MIILDLETVDGKPITIFLSRNANFRLVEEAKQQYQTVIYDGVSPDGITVKGSKNTILMDIYSQIEKLKIAEEMAFGTKG